MPDPSYTGPFSELVNPAGTDDVDGAMTTDVAKSPQDPCPPGYTLVDGVCQPVDDVTTAPGPAPALGSSSSHPVVSRHLSRL